MVFDNFMGWQEHSINEKTEAENTLETYLWVKDPSPDGAFLLLHIIFSYYITLLYIILNIQIPFTIDFYKAARQEITFFKNAAFNSRLDRSLSEALGTVHVMAGRVCDWDRWGAQVEKKEVWGTLSWSSMGVLSRRVFGTLFPVLWLIRYSGKLSQHKTCRRNVILAFLCS